MVVYCKDPQEGGRRGVRSQITSFSHPSYSRTCNALRIIQWDPVAYFPCSLSTPKTEHNGQSLCVAIRHIRFLALCVQLADCAYNLTQHSQEHSTGFSSRARCTISSSLGQRATSGHFLLITYVFKAWSSRISSSVFLVYSFWGSFFWIMILPLSPQFYSPFFQHCTLENLACQNLLNE